MVPLHTLVVDDEEIVCRTLGDYLRDSGHQVTIAHDGTAALATVAEHEFDLALVDLHMPGMDGMSLLDRFRQVLPEMPVVIVTAHGTLDIAVQALRCGATDFLPKPVKLLELDAVVEKCIRFRELLRQKRRLQQTISGLQLSYDMRAGARGLIGNSVATQNVRDQIRQAVEARVNSILITGETGTGKEIVAREIHFQGGSNELPFIAVSCPAIPDTLIESDLFGCVKGAFTGATEDRLGHFELADGGALFLDEIGDLTSAAQAKLLRVLDTRVVKRVGGTKEIPVSVRVIAATNADLEKFMKEGKFRQDLFHRLNVYTIHMTPLRERREDILPLAKYFLELRAKTGNLDITGFSPEAEQMLINYDFPGNGRELRHIVERAAILCRSGCIEAMHLSLPVPSILKTAGERQAIMSALEKTKWNRREAAKQLGIPYSTFRLTLKRLGLS